MVTYTIKKVLTLDLDALDIDTKIVVSYILIGINVFLLSILFLTK